MSRGVSFAILAVCGAAVSASMAQPTLEYLGASEIEPGRWLHSYQGMDDPSQLIPVRDLHIVGRFAFDPGTVTIITPNENWTSVVYTGPGPYLFNWQVEEGTAPGGPLYNFGIVVDNPLVRSTPFHWTNNPRLPDLPDLGNIVASGRTMVPIPAPASVALAVLGAIGCCARRR